MIPDDINFDNEDGVFGISSTVSAKEVYIEEGWLVAQSQVRIRLTNRRYFLDLLTSFLTRSAWHSMSIQRKHLL